MIWREASVRPACPHAQLAGFIFTRVAAFGAAQVWGLRGIWVHGVTQLEILLPGQQADLLDAGF